MKVVFAFLSTAITACLSVAVWIGALTAALFFPSVLTAGCILSFIAAACFVLSVMASFHLYENTMQLCMVDFERWFEKAQRIAKHCVGNTKTMVLLDMAQRLCWLEETAYARDVLRQAKRAVVKSGKPYYQFLYLMQVLSMKRIDRDFSGIHELFATAYACLSARDFGGKRLRKSCTEAFEYARSKMLLYTVGTGALTEEKKRLVTDLQSRAKDHARCELEDFGENDPVLLADCYCIALTHLMLGHGKMAEQYFRYILSGTVSIPLQRRVRQYLFDGDAADLLYVLP